MQLFDTNGCFLVAEVGANHDGDIDKAFALIELAKKCGADAVKFQCYTPEDLLVDTGRLVTWGPPGNEVRETISEMFSRLTLSLDDYAKLIQAVHSCGLTPIVTPFSPRYIPFFEGCQLPIYKVASSDLCYTELLKALGGTKKPVILSSGKSTLSEVDQAILFLEASGCPQVILMHCVASYPAPYEEIHLPVIQSYRHLYPDLLIGYSDHSQGIAASLGAVALGARVIEKHITLDRQAKGPDHWFSSDPQELKLLIDSIRALEKALHPARKQVTPSEVHEKQISTRSLAVTIDLNRGAVLEEKHLKLCRPGYGIHPFDKEKVIGLTLQQPLKANAVLTWNHLQHSTASIL